MFRRNLSLKAILGYVIIGIAGVAIAMAVYLKSEKDYADAKARYQQSSQKEAQDDAARVSEQFTQIYQGIRTISMLPSVKNIDRYGKNLDGNAHESIIQIYKNLRSNVVVSEVYVVPVTLEPERVDPITGNLETPILMFDDEVAAHKEEAPGAAVDAEPKITTIEQAEKVEEVEIYEYRALKDQMAYLKMHYGVQAMDADKMDVPIIGSSGVLTCDNGDYENTKIDSDRVGVMLSVPFYDNQGILKGTVTAVLRDNVMRDMIPPHDVVLLNNAYQYKVYPKDAGQEALSAEWVEHGKSDPALIFSVVQDVKTNDPRSQWQLWVGYPNNKFTESGDAKAIEHFRYFGYGFAGVVALIAAGIYAMIRHNIRMMKHNNAELERKVSERTAEVERMIKEQDTQKAIAEQERKKALRQMADNFEQSVKGVVTQVVSASSQMQSGSENMTHIAVDTKERSGSVAKAAQSSAQISGQVSAAAEELTASIQEISNQTQKTSRIANDVEQQATHAKEVIEQLSHQSNKVSEIVDVINTIADQINLLALNATIESARAGEAGKGFAVVASEVKQLASQVNRATEEIASQIGEMQNATQVSVESVLSILRTINDVTHNIQAVAAAVEEQSAVTNEIARNISLAASGARDISSNIVSVQEGANKTGVTASEVFNAAKNLSTQSATLQHKMEEFLKMVRAA